MKKFYLLLIVLLALNGAKAQNCLPSGITFNWQADIDNFQTNYPGCTKIGGNVTISSFDITNLNGLSVLTSIGGTLSIYVDVLSSLSGLQNLTSIGGDLIIQNNDSLRNLAELEKLASVGNIWLRYDHLLASLGGLDNVTISGGLIWIIDNDTLSDCAVKSICNYLAGSGTAWIENNAAGCNSPQEVQAACGVGLDEKYISENHLILYPNPSSDKITVESDARGRLSILDLSGRQLLQREIAAPASLVDISTLPSGVYFVRLVVDKSVHTGKFFKQ
jgi:hypothetical protein